jgi:ABC-type spermidine/putrescine transport system permease subunit I
MRILLSTSEDIVQYDEFICASFMPCLNNYKQWTEDPTLWSLLVNTQTFDLTVLIICLITVVTPYYELKYFAIFWLICQNFL